MDEIIGRLIKARHSAKLSLQEIHERTKIPLRQLEYLESYQYDKIGPPVYIKGFVRRYAQEVGIDVGTLGEQENPRIALPTSRSARRRKLRFDFAPLVRIATILTLLVIVGILIRTAVLTYFQPDPPAPPDVPPGQDEPTPGNDQDDPIEEPEPEPVVTVEQLQADDSEAVYVVHNAAALDIILTFSDRCWTRITADGEGVSESTYGAGHQEQLTGADVFRIRFGAPKFVSVSVNGVDIETPKVEKGFNLEIRLQQTE